MIVCLSAERHTLRLNVTLFRVADFSNPELLRLRMLNGPNYQTGVAFLNFMVTIRKTCICNCNIVFIVPHTSSVILS